MKEERPEAPREHTIPLRRNPFRAAHGLESVDRAGVRKKGESQDSEPPEGK